MGAAVSCCCLLLRHTGSPNSHFIFLYPLYVSAVAPGGTEGEDTDQAIQLLFSAAIRDRVDDITSCLVSDAGAVVVLPVVSVGC